MFFITTIIFILLIVFLLWVLSMIWPPDSPWAPWWQTKKETAEKICQLAEINEKDVIYDLGCGTGTALLVANQLYGAKGVGIEIDFLRVCIAKWRAFLSSLRGAKRRSNLIDRHVIFLEKNQLAMTKNDILILRKNFFSVDISPASVVFVYLVPKALKRLVSKFLKELRPGTKIVSYIYPLPVELLKGKLELIKYDIRERIFVYQII